MKRLAILRHAKSSWDLSGVDDFSRPLSERGRKAARRMGRELKERSVTFDIMIASPAARARETLDALSETYGEFPVPVRFEPKVYMAAAVDLLGLVHEMLDDAGTVLLVGHNPGLERLVLGLTGEDTKGLRRRVAEKFPTGAFAVVELPAECWRNVEEGSGTLVELILPRELD